MEKKNFILAGVAAMMFLASCDHDPDNYVTLDFNTCNLVIPTDGVSDVTAANATYTIKLNYTKSRADVTTSTLQVNNRTYGMQLTDLAFRASSLSGDYLEIASTDPGEVNGLGLPVKDLKLATTSYFNLYPELVPGVAGITVFNPLLIMNYKLGDDYIVKTFCRDNTFKGTTLTQFQAQDNTSGTYQNDGISYRVVMNVDKKKADVVIYNAKFAEAAPEIKAMVLFNLDVDFTSRGYVVRGNDITPDVVEGQTTTPNPRFPFNSFSLETTDDNLTNVRCEYTVAGRYQGTFTGTVFRKE